MITSRQILLSCTLLLGSQCWAQTGLNFESEDGQSSMTLNGRIQIDGALFDEDASEIDNDVEFRRARLTVKGKVHGDWTYATQLEFSGDDVDKKDLYIGHTPSGIRIGQFYQPTSLSQMISSKYLTLMERASVIESLATGRRLGVGWNHNAADWTVFASAYDSETDGGNQAPGFGVRTTWTPIRDEGRLLHLGATLISEGPGDDDTDSSRFRSRPESHLANRLIDTGTLSDVDRVNKVGIEAAWVQGPWSLQSEYLRADVSRDAGFADVELDGYYLMGSYFLTGESRPYKNGVFTRVTPRGDRGAWELAARYAHTNLNDGLIEGGESDVITLGVNYYPHKHVRFMANYVMADTERAGISDDPNVFQIRAQIDF